MNYPIEIQIAAVKRELAMRERVYPRWVDAGKTTQAKADHELAVMREVLATLERLRDSRPTEQQDIFGSAA